MNARKTRRKFTQEFKDGAVNLVIEQGYSCAEVGRRLGVKENNINRWVRQYRDNNEEPGIGFRVALFAGSGLEVGGSLYRGPWDDAG